MVHRVVLRVECPTSCCSEDNGRGGRAGRRLLPDHVRGRQGYAHLEKVRLPRNQCQMRPGACCHFKHGRACACACAVHSQKYLSPPPPSPAQFNEQLISPKEFVCLAGKSTLKDWKRAIRLNSTMLRSGS